MKTIAVVLCLVSTNAFALDFNTEWNLIKARFTIPIDNSSTTQSVIVTPIDSNKPEIMEMVDPKSPDRLGYKISDPEMRKRVIEAYNKPNAVVYSYTLR